MKHRVSIVIPVFNEGENVKPVLRRIFESVKIDAEVLVVYDDPSDDTVPAIDEMHTEYPALRGLHNTLGRGPANAIKFGIDASESDVVVVTMADGCDDASQIEVLTRLVERGVVVTSASRYARTGQQVGGPFVKGLMSKIAGLTLYYGARVGTRDATNSFKAYSSEFIRQVGIESDKGFEIGIELVAKARRHRRPVAEIPTIWLNRSFGVSNFKLTTWLPRYLKWYFYAFGPKK